MSLTLGNGFNNFGPNKLNKNVLKNALQNQSEVKVEITANNFKPTVINTEEYIPKAPKSPQIREVIVEHGDKADILTAEDGEGYLDIWWRYMKDHPDADKVKLMDIIQGGAEIEKNKFVIEHETVKRKK